MEAVRSLVFLLLSFAFSSEYLRPFSCALGLSLLIVRFLLHESGFFLFWFWL